MSTPSLRRQPSFSGNTSADSSASTPNFSQQHQSDSEPSTAATTPERDNGDIDDFKLVSDPLGATFHLYEERRRGDLEDAARITHATPGPTGPLGLAVGHAREANSHLSTNSARLIVPVDSKDTKVALGIERNAASIIGTKDVQGGTLSVGLANTAGFINANAAYTTTGGQNVGGLLGTTTSGVAGAGLSTLQKVTPSLGVGLSVIGVYGPNAKTKVTNALAERVEIERERTNMRGAQAQVTVGVPLFGVSARTFAATAVEQKQQQQVTAQQAKEALKDNGFLKRKLIGMNFTGPFTTHNAIARPGELKNGEVAIEAHADARANSAAISAVGVHLGGHKTGRTDSSVTLKRSGSGSKKSLSVNSSRSKSKSMTVDVPVLASVTLAKTITQATDVSLDFDQGNDPSKFINRSTSMLGLSENFNLPEVINLSSLAKANDPKSAFVLVLDAEKEMDQGVSINQITISSRRDSTHARGSLLPLTKTLFGNLAGNAYERNSADIHEVSAGPTHAKIVTGHEQTMRKETVGQGTHERRYSFLEVQTFAEVLPKTGPAAEYKGERTSFLVANNTFEQCSVQGLNLLGKWTNQYIRGPALTTDAIAGSSLPRFSATASVLVRLETEDKLRLHRNSFFKDLPKVSLFDDAGRKKSLVQTLDEQLAEMLKHGDSALKKLTSVLESPTNVSVDIKVDIVDQLVEKANLLSVNSASPLPKSGGFTSAFKRRLARVSELYSQVQRLKKVFAHPTLTINSDRLQAEKERIASLEQQILRVVDVSDPAELARLQRRVNLGFPIASPDLPPATTHRDAAVALAAPIAHHADADGDLGSIPMSNLSSN